MTMECIDIVMSVLICSAIYDVDIVKEIFGKSFKYSCFKHFPNKPFYVKKTHHVDCIDSDCGEDN